MLFEIIGCVKDHDGEAGDRVHESTFLEADGPETAILLWRRGYKESDEAVLLSLEVITAEAVQRMPGAGPGGSLSPEEFLRRAFPHTTQPAKP